LNPSSVRGVRGSLARWPFHIQASGHTVEIGNAATHVLDEGILRIVSAICNYDWTAYAPNTPRPKKEWLGRSIFNVLTKIVENDPWLTMIVIGGTAFRDPTGDYDRFWRQVMTRILEHAKSRNLRVMLGTGGGPGWPMTGTVESYIDVAKTLGIHCKNAMRFCVLARILGERTVPPFGDDWIIRPQDILDIRELALVIAASVVFEMPGGKGTNAEHSGLALANQLFGQAGPSVPGIALNILMDSPLDPQPVGLSEIMSILSLREAPREFDGLELQRMIQMIRATIAASDDALTVRLPVDANPPLWCSDEPDPIKRADRFATELIDWRNAIEPFHRARMAALKRALEAIRRD